MAAASEVPQKKPSKLVTTAMAAVNGYNTWTIEAIIAPRAPTCTQQVLPASLGRPPLSNEDYVKYFSPLIPAFENFHVTILDTFEDQPNNKVAFHASSTAETPIGEYRNEYVLMLHMTEDQENVVHIKEFVDSVVSVGYLTKLREHMAKQQSQK